jgi:protein-S-isoprenylcysteine O-methyltransferase Ste14
MSDSNKLGPVARTLLRIPVPWVFVLVYLVGAGVEVAFHRGGFLRDRAWLNPAGLVVFALGAVLAGWGWITFYRAKTTRVPGENSTSLVSWGPYRFTRNPMYVGLSLGYIGEAAIQHQLVPVILLPLVIVYLNKVVIPVEEERLGAVFGQEYEQYRKKVGRWI